MADVDSVTLQGSSSVLVVSDIESTISWYRTNLGFNADPFPEAPPYVFCILSKDGVDIMLQRLAGYQKPELYSKRPGGVWDVYLRVKGVKEFAERVSKLPEVMVVEPLRRQPYGQTEIVIRDPNGYVLVFAEAS
jgi:predicted enzyme related to lactoylglutathione lyase